MGAQHRLGGGCDRARLVVPFGVVADERALILRGVDPVDPWPALGGIDRAGGAEHDNRGAIAPGVEDRHRRMHQPDIAVDDRAHRPAGHLGVAVRHRDGVLLVQAEQHLRIAVAEQIDEAVVQAAIGGAGVQRNIGDVELAQHQRDRVRAPVIAGFVAERRPLDRPRAASCVGHAFSPQSPSRIARSLGVAAGKSQSLLVL